MLSAQQMGHTGISHMQSTGQCHFLKFADGFFPRKEGKKRFCHFRFFLSFILECGPRLSWRKTTDVDLSHLIDEGDQIFLGYESYSWMDLFP